MSYNTPEPIYYRISRGDIALFDIYFKDGTRSFIYVNYKSEYDALGAKNIYQSSEIIDGKLTDNYVFLRHTQFSCKLGVFFQMLVFTVYRDKEFRLCKRLDKL